MDASRRVKVYKMVDGTWQDMGTGEVECTMLADDTPGIVVRTDTEDKSVFLQSRIPPGTETFLKQQDTLIVWNEVDEHGEMLDLALSFQEEAGCTELWTQIQDIQQSLTNTEIFSPDLFYGSIALSPREEGEESDRGISLPPANLGHIDEWVTLLQSSTDPQKKQTLGEAIFSQDYVPKFVDLFRVTRDFENMEDLVKMFHIFKHLCMYLIHYEPNITVLLENRGIIENLVDPEVVLDVMEALEYDPTVRAGTKVCHSKFLKEQVVFKEVSIFMSLHTLTSKVFPFTHPKILPKIHQSFYLQYLKDVALLPSLDDSTTSLIASMVYVNNVQVLTHLTSNGPWLASVFEKVQATEDANELRDQLGFLAEFCDLSQQLELNNKLTFHRSLVASGLYETIQRTMCFDDTKVRQLSVMVSSANLRSYTIQKKTSTDESAMLEFLISRFHLEPDYGIKNLIAEVMRILLIDESSDNTEDHQELLNLFYVRYARSFFAPLLEPSSEPDTEASSLLKNHLCDFLSILAEVHGSRMKILIIDNDIMTSVLNYLLRADKYLALASLRVLKKLVITQEPSLINYIINKELLAPVVDIFLEQGDKYTIFNSAILELFHIIGTKKIKPLLSHYMTNFHEKLQHITYIQTFQNLKLIYERAEKEENTPKEELKRCDTQEIIYDEVREKYRQRFAEEKEAEAWFESEEEEEANESGAKWAEVLEEGSKEKEKRREIQLSPDWLLGDWTSVKAKEENGHEEKEEKNPVEEGTERRRGLFRTVSFSKKREREEEEQKEEGEKNSEKGGGDTQPDRKRRK